MSLIAYHEFGIMPGLPLARYDGYEPQKYDCIALKDDYFVILNPLLTRASVKMFSHSLNEPCIGLNESGITLIPPDSSERIADIALKTGEPAFGKLIKLLRCAAEDRKYVIHFGI